MHITDKKLISLCDKQLRSTIEDAEQSIANVTREITVIKDLLLAGKADVKARLMATDQQSGVNEAHGLESSLDAGLNNVLVNLQFFDEFHQRINHALEVLELLECENFLEQAKHAKGEQLELLEEKIKKIFSIQSEFEVIHEVFPHLKLETGIKDIELF